VPNINDANNKMFFMIVNSKITSKVLLLEEVANFVTGYFPLKIKFCERKREFTTKFAIGKTLLADGSCFN
jgi:hypothetical protein